MATVVIAEKPSVALDIGKVLGASTRREGFFESKDGSYRVTWALGHLLHLPRPHEINPAWKAWRAELLPMLPKEFPLAVRDARAQAQLTVIAKLLKDRRTLEIVNACDAGREGELIFRYIVAKIGITKPCKRLWINALTMADIHAGFESLKPSAAYDGLADAGRARDQADWLLGMNASRAVRLATGREFSVGRVQTPTLAMVVARDRAIREHVAADYYEVSARFRVGSEHVPEGDPSDGAERCVRATYVRVRTGPDGKQTVDARLWPSEFEGKEDETPAAIRDRAAEGAPEIRSIVRKEKSLEAPELYDLTTLQRTANYRFGWSASKTLELLQKLYEEYKVVSYPRTDSRHLSTTVAATLGPVIEMLRPMYRALMESDTGRAPLGKRHVDDKKVSDHHAIIPTATPPSMLVEGSELYRLYDLVCRRLLAAWQPPYIESVTEVEIDVVSERCRDRYVARGVEVVALGWRTLEPMLRAAGESPLPSGLASGMPIVLHDATLTKKKTRAPQYHTEATLLSAMENAGEQLGPDAPAAIREAMRDRGLGTPATRAAIIETLVTRGYVVRERKALKSTELGQALVQSVADTLTDPALTGDWEARLRRIERGEDSYDAFMEATAEYVRACVADAFTRCPSPSSQPPPSALAARTPERPLRSSGGRP